jgi:uncharacterized protein
VTNPNALREFRSLNVAQFNVDGVHFLFSPETLRLFRLNAASAQVVRCAREGLDLAELCNACHISDAAAESAVANLVSALNRPKWPIGGPEQIPERRVLPKLVFMVNNYCNLNCAYCYEIKTVFNCKPAMMPQEIVDAALQAILDRFAGIRQVMFIGGEPNLSPSVIDFSCRRALEVCEEKGFPVPSFCIMTNGTKMDGHMFALIEKYRIQVTFSLDGPKQVHDAVRIRKDGRGSYDEAAGNLANYIELFEGLAGIECTLNRTHQEAGVGISDLLQFFHSQFGILRPHITAVGLAESEPLRSMNNQRDFEVDWAKAATESARNVLDSLANPASQPKPALHTVCSMIDRLISRRGNEFMCPAGVDQLVVDPLGDVYPCWMFATLPNFKLGNVDENKLFSSDGERALAEIQQNSKTNLPGCSTCFARSVCGPCIGNNYNCTGSIGQMDEHYCLQVRTILQAVLVEVVKAQEDVERWNSIRGGIKRSIRQRQAQDIC